LTECHEQNKAKGKANVFFHNLLRNSPIIAGRNHSLY